MRATVEARGQGSKSFLAGLLFIDLTLVSPPREECTEAKSRKASHGADEERRAANQASGFPYRGKLVEEQTGKDNGSHGSLECAVQRLTVSNNVKRYALPRTASFLICDRLPDQHTQLLFPLPGGNVKWGDGICSEWNLSSVNAYAQEDTRDCSDVSFRVSLHLVASHRASAVTSPQGQQEVRDPGRSTTEPG